MSYIVLCPFVHRPSFDAMMNTLDPDLADEAIVLDNTVENLGAAGSRNVGIKRLRDEGAEWLVDISPAARFGPPGGLDFLAFLDANPDAWVVQSASPVNWHCMGWHRRLFETVGDFDENFWPIYGEDGDIAYRYQVAARSHPDARWTVVDTDAWITMYGHSHKLAGVRADQETLWAYYTQKWGGRSGHERFAHPFDDPTLPLGFSPPPSDPRSIYDRVHGG
jgi:hypothetical protein